MIRQSDWEAERAAGARTLAELKRAGKLPTPPEVAQYVFDFEFVEGNPCLPISMGIIQVHTEYRQAACGSWPCQATATQECPHDPPVHSLVREGYWEWPDAWEKSGTNEWLMQNVRPRLEMRRSRLPAVDALMPWSRLRQVAARAEFIAREEGRIAAEVRQWLGDGKYELIASYGAYDFFLLSQLLGGFQGCPKNFPYTYRDAVHMDLPRVGQVGAEHNALADARTIRAAILAKSDPH